LRVKKLESMKGATAVSLYKDMLDVVVYDAAGIVAKNAYDAIYSFAAPEDSAKLTKAIDILAAVKGVNVKEARRRIADKLISDNAYKF